MLAFPSERIIHRACELFDLTRAELTTKSRAHKYVRPRQMCMLVIYEQGRLSQPQIARMLGIGDHSTVMHGIKKARELATFDYAFALAVNELREAAA